MEWGHSDIVSGLTQYSTVVSLVQQLAGEVRARESKTISEENCALVIVTFRVRLTLLLADLPIYSFVVIIIMINAYVFMSYSESE